jgi:hypothetical protein
MVLNIDNLHVPYCPGDNVYSIFNDMVFRFKVAEVRLVFTKYDIELTYLPEGCTEAISEDDTYPTPQAAFNAIKE